MASSPGGHASLSSQKSPLWECSRSKKLQVTEEELFYMNCRAAYLTVFKSSLESIMSRDQLCIALQKAGRNPSQKTIDKYWTPQTAKLNFDDFCAILKKEKPTSKSELLKAFKKIDVNNDGYILHTDLYKILTKRGEKMTAEEMHVIINLADINADGKLDYNKFCKLYVTTNEQCLKTALEKLEIDSKMRLQQLGSHLEGSSESGTTPLSKPSPRIIKKTDQETMLNREGIHKEKAFLSDGRNSLPLAPRKYRSSTSFNISMPANSFRTSKLLEPNSLKEWQCAQTKGCFFLEENGEIVSHQYKIHLTQRSMVFLTIKPLNLSQEEGKFIVSIFSFRRLVNRCCHCKCLSVYFMSPFHGEINPHSHKTGGEPWNG